MSSCFGCSSSTHAMTPPPPPPPPRTVPYTKRHQVKVRSEEFTVDEFYTIQRRMGGGAYGIVAKALDTRTDTQVAIKKIKGVFHNLEDAKRILREMKLMTELHHPNIVKLVDILNPVDRDFDDVYLVMEFMQADLHRTIYSRTALSPAHIAYIMYQVLCGLKHMHSAGVLHRDLKPGNILINKDCSVKICDFGLARGTGGPLPDGGDDLTEYVVTRWYRAPEVVLCPHKYGEAVDMWAVGCIFAELYHGKPVFQGKDYVDQLREIFRVIGTPGDQEVSAVTTPDALGFLHRQKHRPRMDLKLVFPTADALALDFLDKVLVFDPVKRLNVDQALRHPFFGKFHSETRKHESTVTVDLSHEGAPRTRVALQRLMVREVARFRPDAPDLL